MTESFFLEVHFESGPGCWAGCAGAGLLLRCGLGLVGGLGWAGWGNPALGWGSGLGSGLGLGWGWAAASLWVGAGWWAGWAGWGNPALGWALGWVLRPGVGWAGLGWGWAAASCALNRLGSGLGWVAAGLGLGCCFVVGWGGLVGATLKRKLVCSKMKRKLV